MSRIVYMVTATLPDAATAEEFVAWLQGGHIAEVVSCGAESGIVVRVDTEAAGNPRVMAQYIFPSRAALDRYVAVDAPRLRAEGLAKFPPGRGVTFERRVGTIDESGRN